MDSEISTQFGIEDYEFKVGIILKSLWMLLIFVVSFLGLNYADTCIPKCMDTLRPKCVNSSCKQNV